MGSPAVSIVVRCFNEEEHIGRLLCGILQQTVKDIDIVIVDSGSTDATLSIASRYPVRIATIAPREFSFGRALNIGCRAAFGEFVVIASGHVYPKYDNWLETLLAPFGAEKVALVYGKQRGNETTRYSERQIFAKWFPDRSDDEQNHPFCNNANAAIRRSVWETNCYNESLTGLEDLDWAKKILQMGYRIAYAAEAEIIHVHDETPLRIYNRYQREALAMSRIYPAERFHFLNFLALFVRNVANDYYHAWHDRQLRANLFAVPTFRLMQFWGTYRGFSKKGPVNDRLKQSFYFPRGFSRSSGEVSVSSPGRVIDYSDPKRERVNG